MRKVPRRRRQRQKKLHNEYFVIGRAQLTSVERQADVGGEGRAVRSSCVATATRCIPKHTRQILIDCDVQRALVRSVIFVVHASSAPQMSVHKLRRGVVWGPVSLICLSATSRFTTCSAMTDQKAPPGQTPHPLGHTPSSLLPYLGRLESGPRLVGRIGSGVRVSASLQKNFPQGSVLRQQNGGGVTP